MSDVVNPIVEFFKNGGSLFSLSSEGRKLVLDASDSEVMKAMDTRGVTVRLITSMNCIHPDYRRKVMLGLLARK